jgi:chromosome segregation ATPase
LNIVSDIAFGARSKPGEEKPSLNEVLTELEVSQRESDDLYDIPPFDGGVAKQPDPPPASSEIDETQRRAAGHRQRLEKLLTEARQIEEMLAKEAAEARALAEKVNLEEKRAALARAVEDERQAATQASELTARRDTVLAQQTQTAEEVRVLREALDAAAASVKAIEAQFAEAQKLVTQTKVKLRESETRAEQVTAAVDNAKIEARNAERRAAKCREARETAEAELRKVEEIANSIALTAATLERMRALGSDPAK